MTFRDFLLVVEELDQFIRTRQGVGNFIDPAGDR